MYHVATHKGKTFDPEHKPDQRYVQVKREPGPKPWLRLLDLEGQENFSQELQNAIEVTRAIIEDMERIDFPDIIRRVKEYLWKGTMARPQNERSRVTGEKASNRLRLYMNSNPHAGNPESPGWSYETHRLLQRMNDRMIGLDRTLYERLGEKYGSFYLARVLRTRREEIDIYLKTVTVHIAENGSHSYSLTPLEPDIPEKKEDSDVD